MARSLRYEAAGAVYHVMARGDGGKNVFDDDKDRFAWTDLMKKAHGRYGWRVHAWVLMGNHFHLTIFISCWKLCQRASIELPEARKSTLFWKWVGNTGSGPWKSNTARAPEIESGEIGSGNAFQQFHPCRQIGFRSFHQQVKMLVHQHPRVNPPTVAFAHLA